MPSGDDFNLIDLTALKRFDRYSTWVMLGLTAAYLLALPMKFTTMLAALPILAAGWFYGARGGLVAALLSFIFNLAILQPYRFSAFLPSVAAFEADHFFIGGHVIAAIAGMGIGRLRYFFESHAQAEAALQASEERYKSLYERSSLGIYNTTPSGEILLANPALLKMLGYESFEQLAERNLEREGFSIDSPRSLFQESIARDGRVVGFESQWARRDGSTFCARETAQAIYDSAGNILRYEGVVEDVTEQRRLETALLEREARLKSILDASMDAILTVSESQNILSFSKSAEIVFGYRADEVIGKPFSILLPKDSRPAQWFMSDFLSAAESGRSAKPRREVFARRKTGEVFPTEASVSKFQFKQQILFAVFLRDITERKQAEEDLREQARFLSLLNEMTQSILTAKNFNEMTKPLTNSITTLLGADSCYITRWDAARQQVFPAATNNASNPYFLQLEYPKDEPNLTAAALKEKRIVIVEDYKSSPRANPNFQDKFNERSFLSIPLLYGEHPLGAVIVGFMQQRVFRRVEVERAQQAGGQIALAMWTAQQEIEIKRKLSESQTLANIALALSESESVSLDHVLNLIVRSAQNLIANAEQAVIHLVHEEEGILASAAVAGFEELEGGKKNISLGKGVAGQVALTGETINILDVNTDPRFMRLDVAPAYRSLLAAPVLIGKRKLGVISVQSSRASAFTPDDVALLGYLGTHAAIAIENAHLLESTQQALKEVNALYRINKGLAASLEPDDLLQDTVELLQKNFDYHYVQIFVADENGERFIMRAGSGKIGAQLKASGYQLDAGEGIVGYTAETGEAFFTNNVDEVVSYARNPLLPDAKSELAAPVKINDRIVGLLDVHQTPPRQLTEQDLQLVSAVADQLAVALQKADLYENLQISLQQEKAIRNQLMQNERLTVMGRLLATVSHELNNPLQAIQNALFLLQEEKGISPQGRQDLGIVLAESERMANMIERLRATYRPIQAEDFQPTQMNEVIEDVYALLATHMRHHQIAFEFHPAPSLPAVPALKDQIRQVILNLLMNAIEAMPDGGAIAVSTQRLAEENQILLTISDTGPGIPSKLLPTIFEAFVTGKDSGTGLGLTISYDIVVKHRGQIRAENNPERGATFKVWLPTNNGEIL
ncbi:MAG: hypothetical protein Fur002_02200 [Anaerolineales bacterium]